MEIVKVRYISETTRRLSDREYTYYSEKPLELGVKVNVPVKDTVAPAVVTTVDVPEEEIQEFKNFVKTIPAP